MPFLGFIEEKSSLHLFPVMANGSIFSRQVAFQVDIAILRGPQLSPALHVLCNTFYTCISS